VSPQPAGRRRKLSNLQLALSIGIPTLAILITFVHNNARFNSIDQRLNLIEADLRRFYEMLGRHDGKIQAIEDRLNK
jgi:hypothetical protein